MWAISEEMARAHGGDSGLQIVQDMTTWNCDLASGCTYDFYVPGTPH